MFIAVLMLLGITAVWLGPEPEVAGTQPKTMNEAVRGPLVEFFARDGAWMMLTLIILYKLGDAFAGSLTTSFLIRGVGFSVGEVGAINKGMGLAALRPSWCLVWWRPHDSPRSLSVSIIFWYFAGCL